MNTSDTLDPTEPNPTEPIRALTVEATRAPSPARAALRAVGAGFFPLAFVSRLPFAMTVVGVLTIVSSVRGSVTEAGILSAVAGIGTAAFGPLLGSFADKHGQRRVLLFSAAVNVASLVGFVLLTFSTASALWLAVVVFALGASTPQVAPMSRTRLVSIVTARTDGRRRAQALSLVMSYESVADELAFVLGPVAVGVIASALGAGAPLAIAAGITAVFVVAFALHRTAKLPIHEPSAEEAATRTRLFSFALLVLPVGMFFVGGFFGSVLTALTVFMRDQGHELATGIVYGGMSIGSVVTAVLIAFAPRRFTLRARWLCFAGIALAAVLALVAAPTIAFVVVGLVAAGFGIGVVIVTIFTTANQRTPAARTTTVMTMLSSALIVGQALFSALGGIVSDAFGSSAGFALAAAAAVAIMLAASANFAADRVTNRATAKHPAV
ncbi:MFS transporter [Rathayibacter soli]|uniref:MFS transporter n=1 Tax=Rathayibacter soli TaxID=3144168 RepID=UPI0027E41EAD|nr:MFS transporter [Glaciibacter superstes]